MSFVDDADTIKRKLHLRDMPVLLRVGLVVVGVAVLFILFQGLWQLGANETHLFDHSAAQGSSAGDSSETGLTITKEDDSSDTDQEADQKAESPLLSVHVVGAVKNPGLYELAEGSRVKEAIDAAGGMTQDAEDGSVNLARTLSDGEQIVVLSKSAGSQAQAQAGQASNISSATQSAGGSAKVNINTADVAALTTLSGVGEATAKKIVADREKNGPFKSAKDITRVSGIGDKKYEAIKDSITV